MVDVSVVVVSWNTRELLCRCLRSIIEQTHDVSFEIFVVDNASSDKSAEVVRSEFPEVNVVSNDENRGFAAANNQGMRAASGRYILLLNPDTIILDRAICRCVSYADAHVDVGIVGCQVLEDEHRIQATSFAFPTPWNLFLTLSGLSAAFPRSRLFGRPQMGWWDRNSERDVDVVSGMFMLVRRKAIEQVGLMDEAYFVYAEESDWCYRFCHAGWRRVFTPSARIMHVHGGGKSTGLVNVRMFVQLQKSLLIYHKKNLGFAAWLVAKVIYILSDLARAVIWFFWSLWNRDPSVRTKRAAAWAALCFHVRDLDWA